MKILFWGTGGYAAKWIECNTSIFHYIKYKKFINSAVRENVSDYFFNTEVIPPSKINNESYDYICIMSSFFEEIKNTAVKTYHVPIKKIIGVKELSEIIIGKLYYKNGDEVSDAIDEFGSRVLMNYLSNQEPSIYSLLKDYYDYEYLKCNYQYYLENYTQTSIIDVPSNREKIIWLCWFQGYDAAPDIVKACINSVKKYMKNYKIILITEDNFKQYVTFPDYILEKYEKGIFTKTHFSDLLRLELLINYGGIWIDSTVLLTEPIPEFIQNANLFIFDFNRQRMVNPNIICSWFIVCDKKNKILILTQKLLYDYWKTNNSLNNYLLFHYFFRLATEKLSDEWSKSYHMAANTGALWERLFDSFENSIYDFIKKTSFCHKLSYKMALPQNIHETFYEKLLEEFL